MSPRIHAILGTLLVMLTMASERGFSADSDDGSKDDGASALIGTGDFNQDGIADIVEAVPLDGQTSHPHSLQVRLGQPDGSFRTATPPYPLEELPRSLVVGDFNGDGKLDVIVGQANGAILEFFGDGKGNLSDAGSIASVGSVVSMAVGHFTRKGNLDLAISDFRSNTAVIFKGNGDGSFRLAWSFELPRRGTQFHIATADFNKDGIADLVITSEDSNDYEVMLGTGNGTFTYAPELSYMRDPNSYCPS